MRARAIAVVCLLAGILIGAEAVAQFRLRVRLDAQDAAGLSSGDIVLRLSGSCGAGFSEVAALDGRTLVGTLTAHGNVDTTGGADTVAPAGTNSAPAFTGEGLAEHAHGVGTLAVADHLSHTHTYADVLTHTHTVSVTDPGHLHAQQRLPTATGAVASFTVDTSMSGTAAAANNTASATTGISASTAAPAGSTATGTTAGPSAALSHSLSGSAAAVGAGTPAGTVAAPTFTGSPFDNRPAFRRVVFCVKD